MSDAGERAFAALQRALPQHALSRLIGGIAASERPWLKRRFIKTFAGAYDVNMSEALHADLEDYASFNAFFTRALKEDARPIDVDPASLISPADGTVSQAGALEQGTLLQAKGFRYDLAALAPATKERFEGGTFATIYLAPKDYHRVHVPLDAKLVRTTEVPGALFSVNASTEGQIEGLFCRNERLVCELATDVGPVLLVMVGALIVASIEVVWQGTPSPFVTLANADHDIEFAKGDELGRFLLGSTVILCLPPGVELGPNMTPGTTVRMGEAIGRLH